MDTVLALSTMVLVQQVTKNAKAMVPFLKPIWAFGVAFSITGYLIWKIPISDETKANSKYYNPGHHDEQ